MKEKANEKKDLKKLSDEEIIARYKKIRKERKKIEKKIKEYKEGTER